VFSTGSAGDPQPQQKGWNPVGEHAIEDVRNRVGSSIDEEKDVDAEGDGEESDDPAGDGDRTKNWTEGLEPGHGKLRARQYIRTNQWVIFVILRGMPDVTIQKLTGGIH
jgi:hypothetical protein